MLLFIDDGNDGGDDYGGDDGGTNISRQKILLIALFSVYHSVYNNLIFFSTESLIVLFSLNHYDCSSVCSMLAVRLLSH